MRFGWFATAPGSDQPVRLLETTQPLRLIALDLELLKLLHTGWRSHRAGAITAGQWEGIAQLAPGLLVTAHSGSIRRNLPSHGCLCVDLAERERAPLVSQDQGLLQKLAATPGANGVTRPKAGLHSAQGY